MTDAWVVTFQDADNDRRVVAATTTLDGARNAASDDLDPDWPAFEWFQNAEDVWVTDMRHECRFTAERFEVLP